MARHLNRKGDAPPRHEKMREGHAYLSTASRAYGRILHLKHERLLLDKLSPDS